MPIYEYTCSTCGCKFEVLHKNNREPKPICSKCGSTEIERGLSLFGFSCGGNFVSSSSKGESCSTCSGRNCDGCK